MNNEGIKAHGLMPEHDEFAWELRECGEIYGKMLAYNHNYRGEKVAPEMINGIPELHDYFIHMHLPGYLTFEQIQPPELVDMNGHYMIRKRSQKEEDTIYGLFINHEKDKILANLKRLEYPESAKSNLDRITQKCEMDFQNDTTEYFKNNNISLKMYEYMTLRQLDSLLEEVAKIYGKLREIGLSSEDIKSKRQGIGNLFIDVFSEDFSSAQYKDQYVRVLNLLLVWIENFKLSEDLSYSNPKTYADQLESNLFQEVATEMDALKKKQEHKIAPNQKKASLDVECAQAEEYRARAHNDAQEEIRKLLDKQVFKRSQIGPNNNCYHYSLLDTQFSLTEYLKHKPVDLRDKIDWKKDQEHFDAYNAAFAEAFTRYYQELHNHMKNHSTRSKQDDGRTYYSVNRPSDDVSGEKKFEFSFEKNPQKENIAVIDREIKEMVSAYQTAFFILESMNSNKDLAEKRYNALKGKFEVDIGRLLEERAACIDKLSSDDLKKDIPQVPTYHVIVSSQRVLEVREPDTNANEKQYLHEKDLKWEESYLKQILSFQTILNCLRMLTRVLQRYVSALTSPHHRQMNQKHAADTKQQLKINKVLMSFTRASQQASNADIEIFTYRGTFLKFRTEMYRVVQWQRQLNAHERSYALRPRVSYDRKLRRFRVHFDVFALRNQCVTSVEQKRAHLEFEDYKTRRPLLDEDVFNLVQFYGGAEKIIQPFIQEAKKQLTQTMNALNIEPQYVDFILKNMAQTEKFVDFDFQKFYNLQSLNEQYGMIHDAWKCFKEKNDPQYNTIRMMFDVVRSNGFAHWGHSERSRFVTDLRDFAGSGQPGSKYAIAIQEQKTQLSDYLNSMKISTNDQDAILKDVLNVDSRDLQDAVKKVLVGLDQETAISEKVLLEKLEKLKEVFECEEIFVSNKLRLLNAFYKGVDELRTICKKNGVPEETIKKHFQKLILVNSVGSLSLEVLTQQLIQTLSEFQKHLQDQFIVGDLLSTDPQTDDALQMSFLKEVVKEIDALKKKQEHKIAPNQATTSDVGSVATTGYRARAHNDAQEEIRKLLDEKGVKRSQIGPANNCYHYSLLDTQFFLTEYLKHKPVDLRDKIDWKKDQEHFDAYSAAFAEAFTRYYQEFAHMKSGLKLVMHEEPTYDDVNPTQDSSLRAENNFRFSFEQSPQKENIAVIDREIKEMVSAYQTAFFILESMNSNNDLAKERYDALRKKFKGDIGELLKERACCIKKLPPDDLKKDIPQAPIYHVIASSETVFEVGQYVTEGNLEWKEGSLKEIFSLQNMLNSLMMLMRVLQRYVSMLTSPHHAQLVFTGKIRAHNRTTAAFEQAQSSLKETQSLLDTERRNYPIPNKNKSI